MKKATDKNHKQLLHQQNLNQQRPSSKSTFSITSLLPSKALDYKQYVGQLEDMIQTQQSSLHSLQSENKEYKQSYDALQKENQQNQLTLQQSIQIIEMLQIKLNEDRETKRADEEILFHRIQQLEMRCASLQQESTQILSTTPSSSSSSSSLENQAHSIDSINNDDDVKPNTNSHRNNNSSNTTSTNSQDDINSNDILIETRETVSYTQPPSLQTASPINNYNFKKLHANLRYVSEQIMEEIIRVEMSGEQCASVIQAIEKDDKELQEMNKVIMKPDTTLVQADTTANFNFGKASLRYPLVAVEDTSDHGHNDDDDDDDDDDDGENNNSFNATDKSIIDDIQYNNTNEDEGGGGEGGVNELDANTDYY